MPPLTQLGIRSRQEIQVLNKAFQTRILRAAFLPVSAGREICWKCCTCHLRRRLVDRSGIGRDSHTRAPPGRPAIDFAVVSSDRIRGNFWTLAGLWRIAPSGEGKLPAMIVGGLGCAVHRAPAVQRRRFHSGTRVFSQPQPRSIGCVASEMALVAVACLSCSVFACDVEKLHLLQISDSI